MQSVAQQYYVKHTKYWVTVEGLNFMSCGWHVLHQLFDPGGALIRCAVPGYGGCRAVELWKVRGTSWGVVRFVIQARKVISGSGRYFYADARSESSPRRA
jgi:hypothetical protein